MLRVLGTTSDPTRVLEIIQSVGLRPSLALRFRHDEFRYPQDWTAAQTWHHEGDPVPGCGTSHGRVVFWGSVSATEFRACGTHERLPVSDGDVVLIDNAKVEHRMPSTVDPYRWFVRAWIAND